MYDAGGGGAHLKVIVKVQYLGILEAISKMIVAIRVLLIAKYQASQQDNTY
jgi:hypothetical protein